MTVEIIYFNGQFKGVGTFQKNITAVAINDKKIFALEILQKEKKLNLSVCIMPHTII